MSLCIVFVLLLPFCVALENGLARTPPMGWLAWTRFMCETNCKQHPDRCISENLFMEMAEIMVREGYLSAGYNRVNIDDCWATRKRDENGRLENDKTRFAHGIKWLAKFMHDRGLLLGLYANYGKYTCMGFPGTEVHNMAMDAETFAQWDVDMLKFDGCFNDPNTLNAAYPKMGGFLNKTRRPMVYSCSWPYYIRTEAKKEPDYAKIASSCNLWRNFNDIQIHWLSVLSIIDFYDQYQDELAMFHGPGHWNDPDMIIIGNPGLTLDQCGVQMALWCLWSAPLLMSNDLRQMLPGTKDLLLNKQLIEINQDPLGIMGKRIEQFESLGIYRKPMTPTLGNFEGNTVYSYAIVFFNRHPTKSISRSFRLDYLGLTYPKGYLLQEAINGIDFGVKIPTDLLEVQLRPTAALVFVAKLEQIQESSQISTNSLRIELLLMLIFGCVVWLLCSKFRRYRFHIITVAFIVFLLWCAKILIY